jgi:hypothetical protein
VGSVARPDLHLQAWPKADTGDVRRRDRALRNPHLFCHGFDRGQAPEAARPIPEYFPTLQLITDRLRRRWQRSVDARADTDVLQDLTRFTVDTTATLVFGKDVNTLESGEDAIQRHIGVIFPMLSYRVNAFLPYWRYFKLPKDYQLDRSLKVVRAFAEEMIGHARQRMCHAPGETPRNLLVPLHSDFDRLDRESK